MFMSPTVEKKHSESITYRAQHLSDPDKTSVMVAQREEQGDLAGKTVSAISLRPHFHLFLVRGYCGTAKSLDMSGE
jgi:hypothetical protein